MPQLINIPGLQAPIGVALYATYGPNTKLQSVMHFLDDADP
jgi:hypothetical protein